MPGGGPRPGARGFALYVHWPFCRAKCPYCDFNSHVREAVDQPAWRDALLAELAHTAARLGPRRLDSIFFGGGTPSLMPPATVAALIDAAAGHWPFADDVEITLEANPTSVEAENFRALAAAGVNRVSLGVQALNDADLAMLGREHSAAEAMAALAAAAAHFPRWSFDLIYARPGQTLEAWQAELGRALALGSSHISLYQLTIERGTAFFGRQQRGELRLPDEELAADLYDATQALTGTAGLPAYEVSNHARPGQESRHNLVYWRYGEYAGIGPGAHARIVVDGARHAVVRRRLPERWLRSVAEAGHGTESETVLDVDERAAEQTMMGLRLSEGIARSALIEETGRDAPALYGRDVLRRLEDLGLLELDAERLRTSPAGRPLLNSLTGELLANR